MTIYSIWFIYTCILIIYIFIVYTYFIVGVDNLTVIGRPYTDISVDSGPISTVSSILSIRSFTWRKFTTWDPYFTYAMPNSEVQASFEPATPRYRDHLPPDHVHSIVFGRLHLAWEITIIKMHTINYRILII